MWRGPRQTTMAFLNSPGLAVQEARGVRGNGPRSMSKRAPGLIDFGTGLP